MKICLFEHCNRFVFSNDYCVVHQYMRTDDKWLNKCQNKTVELRFPIRRYKLPASKEQGLKTSKKELIRCWGFDNQMDMFNQIWFERPHVCQISGSNLNFVPKERRHWMFAHLLPKGLYPYFKLNKENILLIDPEVHRCVDNFTEDMRLKHPSYDFDKWFNLVSEQKEKYNLFLKENVL